MPAELFKTTCTRDCPDACGIVVTVEDGHVTGHRGDPDHPITRGFLCPKGHAYLERFHDAERVLYPMRRSGSEWTRVSWDEALDCVASRMAHCREKYGPQSVLALSYSGVRGQVAKLLGKLFWAHFGGPTLTVGGLSVEADHAAQVLDLGRDGSHEPEDLAHSAGFVVWGKNVAVTRTHWMPFLQQARKRGAPLVVIDPIRCETAEKADHFFQIRPGTDGLLALGVGRLLLEAGALDHAFIATRTVHFEAWRQLVLSRTLQEIAEATDLTVRQIADLADMYATRRPLATLVGLGPGYWTNSGGAVRLIDALAAVTGNLGVAGGGVHTDIDGTAGLDYSVLQDAPPLGGRRVLLPRLGAEIEACTAPPLQMAFIAGANPASSAPDTNRVRAALSSLDFVVVVEQFMTATAELADIVLPCTTYLEMDDLVLAYGHHWLNLSRRVVEPLGETKPDTEILQLLAERLGFGKALEGTPDAWIRRLLVGLDGVTLERLQQGAVHNPRQVRVPFADGQFATPSGKFEFVSAYEAPSAPAGLHLLATKTRRMLNSQALVRDVPEHPCVRVHPQTLIEAGLEDGAEAWVASAVGRVRARVVGDSKVRRDVLLFNPARWKGDASGVNQLREAHLTDVGDTAAFHATRVTLEPA